jgi:hypothetical protein
VGHAGLDVGAILGRAAAGLDAAGGLSPDQRRALADLTRCRTAALGGRVERCPACGHGEYLYHSCRNRHCPKCQAGSRAAWLGREESYLLPVEYHHVVFTLPEGLHGLALRRPRLAYGLLFAAASAAVLELAADPKYLGARVGLVAALHTWGQTLTLHPHLHVLASGGGLSCDRAGAVDERPRWRSCRPGFSLPVRVLGRLFRGKYLAGLRQAHDQGRLRDLPGLTGPGEFHAWLRSLGRQEWVVYSQPPAAGAGVALKYLARYVHRVALSNGRLVAASDEGVTFTYKDYRHGGRQKQLTLPAGEFARRFLRHVLPKGFVRVRHYGLLANRGREQKLGLCRRLLLAEPAARRAAAGAGGQAGPPPRRCPACGAGSPVVVGWLPRRGVAAREDSS